MFWILSRIVTNPCVEEICWQVHNAHDRVKVSWSLCIVVISAFFSPQLCGICLCVGCAFLLVKFRFTGVFFSSFYIVLPVLLAVISGVFLLFGGSIGCVLSNSDSSCLQAWVRTVRQKRLLKLIYQYLFSLFLVPYSVFHTVRMICCFNLKSKKN